MARCPISTRQRVCCCRSETGRRLCGTVRDRPQRERGNTGVQYPRGNACAVAGQRPVGGCVARSETGHSGSAGIPVSNTRAATRVLLPVRDRPDAVWHAQRPATAGACEYRCPIPARQRLCCCRSETGRRLCGTVRDRPQRERGNTGVQYPRGNACAVAGQRPAGGCVARSETGHSGSVKVGHKGSAGPEKEVRRPSGRRAARESGLVQKEDRIYNQSSSPMCARGRPWLLRFALVASSPFFCT